MDLLRQVLNGEKSASNLTLSGNSQPLFMEISGK
jgi:hypothetical protein